MIPYIFFKSSAILPPNYFSVWYSRTTHEFFKQKKEAKACDIKLLN